jgi:hypothetical protein
VMAELGEVARKYPSHASSADDADSHVAYPFKSLCSSYGCRSLNGGLPPSPPGRCCR